MKTLISVYDRLLSVLGIVPGILAGIMALGVALEVIFRNIGIHALGWIIEAVEYGLLAVAMLGTAHLYRTGGHVTVDIIVGNLSGSQRRAALLLSAALCFIVSVVLFVYGLEVTIESYRAGVTHFKSFTIREWVPLSLIPFAAFLLSCETARRIWLVRTGGRDDRRGIEGY